MIVCMHTHAATQFHSSALQAVSSNYIVKVRPAAAMNRHTVASTSTTGRLATAINSHTIALYRPPYSPYRKRWVQAMDVVPIGMLHIDHMSRYWFGVFRLKSINGSLGQTLSTMLPTPPTYTVYSFFTN